MTGRVFVVGDNIDTDQLAPGRYMSGSIAELARHCLGPVRPDFAGAVQPGDILVAGANFGIGSSREQAAEALKYLGLAGVVARSFAGIFYRNAINLGLVTMTAPYLDGLEEGDVAELDVAAARLTVPAKRLSLALDPLPANLKALLDDGGLVPHLMKRFAARRAAQSGDSA